MMSDKVAIVTGSNKGIGFGIVKELCRRGVGIVYLTARDINRGEKAIEELKNDGYDPKFHQLEVNNETSVKIFAEFIKKNHGGVDILINNAGVAVSDFFKTTYEDSKYVLDINYYGALNMQEHFFPILKDNARVINMSSNCGHISNITNSYWTQQLIKDDVKLDEVNAFVQWFLDSVKSGTMKEEDFVENNLIAYRVSKVALSALTRVQQKQVKSGISVNSLHPGFVRTNMTRGAGDLTFEEAGVAPVYLALDVDQSVKGKYFWFDKTEKDWANPELKIYCKFSVIEQGLEDVGH